VNFPSPQTCFQIRQAFCVIRQPIFRTGRQKVDSHRPTGESGISFSKSGTAAAGPAGHFSIPAGTPPWLGEWGGAGGCKDFAPAGAANRDDEQPDENSPAIYDWVKRPSN